MLVSREKTGGRVSVLTQSLSFLAAGMPISSKVDGPAFFGGGSDCDVGCEDIVCWRGLGDARLDAICPGELDLEFIGLPDPKRSWRWLGGLSMGFTGVMELFRSGRWNW